MYAAYRSLTGRLPALAAAPHLANGAWSSKLPSTWHLRPLLYATQRRANSNDPTVDLPDLDRKWRTRWAAIPQSPPRTPSASQEKPKYILPMFPYPSGTLHMGHLRVYTIADVLARYHRLTGKDVITCMGWDAFGLPAENAAVERGITPATWTKANIAKMKEQLVLMNGSWDWSREISTCDPEFYKHTQHIFTLLHEMGLAYQAEAEVNFDPVDKTVLANEQVDSNGCSWRSGAKVEKRKLKQWFLKISEFREELLTDLEVLAKHEAWTKSVLMQQKHWLGKSVGTTVKFPVMVYSHGVAKAIEVFTTRLETLFGVQYLAISPTHPLATQLAATDPELQAFLDTLPGLPPESKVGYLLPHLRAMNPLSYHEDTPDETKASLPVYVAAYVVGDYGEGAVMGVPGHDHRDHAFWMQHNHTEPIRVVLAASEDESTTAMLDEPFEPFVDHGVMTAASGPYKGKTSWETGEMLLAMLEKANLAKSGEKWRLRDWLISRQRYWGAPIPIIHCMGCGAVPVPKEHLPVTLPNVDYHFHQKQTGNPLQAAQEWSDVSCPKCGGSAQRDTDTMDTFVDSSWYFMRFIDPHNTEAPFASDKAKAHLPVDLYVGGTEHAILHLLYARFMYKALMGSTLVHGEDEMVTNVQEPFTRLIAQGMVLGKTFSDPRTGEFLKPGEIDDVANPPQVAWSGDPVKITFEKMSKSKYNGVDPTDVLLEYGADATRAHVLFSAPVPDELTWDEEKISGMTRWLQRVHGMVTNAAHLPSLPDGETPRSHLEKQLQSLDRKAPGQMARWDSNCAVWGKVQEAITLITASYEDVSLNSIISDLMILTNSIARNPLAMEVEPGIERAAVETLIQMIAPIAPATAEEAWQALHPNGGPSIFQSGKFPTVDGSLVFVKPRNQSCSVQVNGKLKTVAVVPLPPPDLSPEALTVWLTAEILRTVEGQGQMNIGTAIRTAKKAYVVKGGKTINFVSGG